MTGKRVFLLHGTDGDPEYNWFPWLKNKLESSGYEVWAPLLPDNHTPNKETYGRFLKNTGWPFEDSTLIGHSSGATTALNLLSSDWFPHIDRTILVGTFLNEKLLDEVDWYEKGQFDGLFPADGYDTDLLRQKSDSFVFLHGSNDPYCSLDDATTLANRLDGEMVIIQDGLHLSSNRKDLPEIIPFI